MRLNSFFLTLAFVAASTGSHAQKRTAMRAYDSATYFRDAADSLWNVEKTTKESLMTSLAILDRGLAYLDEPDVADLAQGNVYLKYRRFNILSDIAHTYSRLRDKENTLGALQKMNDMGGYSFEFMEKDSAFDFIRSEPGYAKMLGAMKHGKELWENVALRTPYRADLPLNEKIGGLSLLWSQAKYNFVHFDHAGLDWNQQYLDYINLVSQTTSTADYYKILIKFYASLHDGHTNVYFPKELSGKFYARPPFRTELIEGRVFITDIFSDTLQKMGIVKGLEILSINNEPVMSYAENNIQPYQSSSTPRDMDVRKFTYGLLAGAKDEPVLIRFRNGTGKGWQQAVPRSGYTAVTSLPAIAYREINNVGYLQLNSFSDKTVIRFYDSIFSNIAKTKSLVIDLRKNGGGSSDIGYHVLSTLTDKPYALSSARITQYNSREGGEAEWYSYPPEIGYPSRKMNYSKPVIVLTSAQTFSAAEDFVVAFSYMKRGKLIGQTTGGSTGNPILFDLPGGGSARVCAKDDRFPDGTKFVGIGIAPDVFITKTVADLFADNDAALKKALDFLK